MNTRTPTKLRVELDVTPEWWCSTNGALRARAIESLARSPDDPLVVFEVRASRRRLTVIAEVPSDDPPSAPWLAELRRAFRDRLAGALGTGEQARSPAKVVVCRASDSVIDAIRRAVAGEGQWGDGTVVHFGRAGRMSWSEAVSLLAEIDQLIGSS